MAEAPKLVGIPAYEIFEWRGDYWMTLGIGDDNEEFAKAAARREQESYKHVRLFKVTRIEIEF